MTFSNHWPMADDVYVNDEGPFTFMIDLGASGIGRIDQSLYQKLNLKLSGTRRNTDGAGNSWTQNTVSVNHLKFGSIEFSNIDLQMRDYWEGVESGILAKDFFADKLLTLDYLKEQIIISDGKLNPEIHNTISYERPFVVKGNVVGTEFNFSIDTGSQLDFHFPKSFLDENNISYHNTGKTTVLKRSGGQSKGFEAKIEGCISIGGLKTKNPVIWYSDLQDSNRINVGSGVLKNYKVIVDQRNKLISFIPKSN